MQKYDVRPPAERDNAAARPRGFTGASESHDRLVKSITSQTSLHPTAGAIRRPSPAYADSIVTRGAAATKTRSVGQ
jgi:hypothetical protein